MVEEKPVTNKKVKKPKANINNTNNEQRPESKQSWSLSLIVLIISLSGVGLIAGLVIVLAEDRESASQLVLTAVLPLFAAWVGTVLAYYFSSESIEAATQSAKALFTTTEEKLNSIPVTDVMLNVFTMKIFKYSDTLIVLDLLNELKQSGKGNRLPFLKDNMQPEYILHKSVLAEALVIASSNPSVKKKIEELTLKDVFEKCDGLKDKAEKSFGVINIDSTLADAQAKMRSIHDCQDVFITDKDGAVIGWITNVDLQKHSKV